MHIDGPELIEDLEIPGYGADEVGFIEETLVLCKPSFIADWGTNLGSSARIFYELSKLHRLFPSIITTDLPPLLECLDRDHAGSRTGIYLRDLDVPQLRGDGVTSSLEQFVRYGRPKRAIFFVDGDHNFHNVYREIEYVYEVAPYAILILHDTRLDPGRSISQFLLDYPFAYNQETLFSQAGMTRLVPIA